MKNLRILKIKKLFPMIFILSMTNIVLAAEYIVKAKGNSFLQINSLLNNEGTKIKDTNQDGQTVLIDIEKSSLESELKRLSQMPEVEYVVENIKLHTFFDSSFNDPKVQEQWALKKVKAEEAWGLSIGNENITVAVIDTGIAWEHEDLQKQIWLNKGENPNNGIDDDNNGYVDDVRGWDFFANDNNPDDETSSKNPGHGTHCAGIIAATGGNSLGIVGMAPGVTLMPIRFLGADGSGDLMSATKAIDYAVNNKADIISASWGAPVQRQQMKPVLEAIERAREKGIIFVAAAANDGKSNDIREVYPANAGFSNVISVAASGPNDEKPNWSNFGRAKVDIAAPGLNILSTLPNNKYGNLSGTSMATPLVSGLLALMLSYSNDLGLNLRPEEMKAILQASSDRVNIETASQGRVSAKAALEHLLNKPLAILPFASTVAVNGKLQFNGINGVGPFTFVSSDNTVAEITEKGELTAKSKGQIKVTVKDSSGDEFTTDRIFVGSADAPKNQCPLQNPMFCQILCSFDPRLPWC